MSAAFFECTFAHGGQQVTAMRLAIHWVPLPILVCELWSAAVSAALVFFFAYYRDEK